MNKRIGALWLKTTQDGKQYFSGVISDLRGDINIAIFPNDRKENANHPDYNIILSEKKEQSPVQPIQPNKFPQPSAIAIPTATPNADIPVIDEEEIDVGKIPF